MCKRPYCTLFMLQSVDGKISTGFGANMDFDKDLPKLTTGIKDYYKAEENTDSWSMISGAVCVKLGANEGKYPKIKKHCSFIIIDHHLLTNEGINIIASMCDRVILVTDSSILSRKPRKNLDGTVSVMEVSSRYEVGEWIPCLYSQYSILRITVQTGGRINSSLLRARMIDAVDLFVAPVLIGGSNTPTLVDGDSFVTKKQLSQVSKLNLIGFEMLQTGFLRLKYSVVKK